MNVINTEDMLASCIYVDKTEPEITFPVSTTGERKKFLIIWNKNISVHQHFIKMLKLGDVSQKIKIVNFQFTCKQNYQRLNYGGNLSSVTPSAGSA